MGAAQKPLFRALYLLGKLDAQAGRKDDARRELTQLTSLNPQHERGRILLSSLETPAPAATPPPVAVVAPTPAPAVAAVAPPPKKTSGEEEPVAAGGDYNKLVAQADRLSENGSSEKARKIYERALQANPQGVEALTGLGYCDLDGERFMGALDHFRQALNVVPEYGEALIGLAEAYKMRSDKTHAVEYYKRYLKSQPGGAKAAMAQKNIRDLEAHLPPPEQPAVEEKKPEKEDKKAPEEAKIGKSDESALPKPPPSDEPPP
jgi:tetratricopeptide (TPR) repeat protein